jgi:predicted N-formylglutamate amidohydrolase
VFQPYHGAIAELLDTRPRRLIALISIHSFTPILDGQWRPWQIGISHWRDHQLAALLLGALRRAGDLRIGCGLGTMCSTVAFSPELVDFLPELGPASGGVGQ